jgi:CheY-like chemotaxis protein
MPGEHLLVIDDSPTVLKVVESALTKLGFTVATATDGQSGLALVREASTAPDLILLDGLIPGSDAADICRKLAADAASSGVPVVVMATKGDDLGERFAKASNVVDYITKPFSPETLQALVSHVVEARTARSRAAGQDAPIPPPGGEAGSGPSAATKQAVAEALSRSTAPPASAAGAGSGYALAGDLGVISMSEVLSLLREQSQTGGLRAVNSGSGASVELFFHAGQIDFAAAVGVAEEFLLGRFAVEAGDLSPEALEILLAERARASERPPLFGVDLVARGLVTPAQLKQAMIRQTCELAYETLRWTAGLFEFRRANELPELARQAALGINVDRLLLQGFRRVDEWRVIEREIASFDEVYLRDEHKIGDVPRGTFTRDELAVLEQVNGRQSVREIVRALRMGSFDVSRILFRLLRTKLIRRRVAPTTA